MGNPGGGTIFGADRLRDLYPGGAPPAPITPAPAPAPPVAPPTGSTGDPNNGLISTIIGDQTSNVPVNGANVPGNTMQPGGGLLPKTGAPNTGVMVPPEGMREKLDRSLSIARGGGGIAPVRGGGEIASPRSPISGMLLNNPNIPQAGFAPQWGATMAPDKRQQVIPPPAPVSQIVSQPAAPTTAPVTPAAPAKVAPNAKPGETMEQFRARIARQRKK